MKKIACLLLFASLCGCVLRNNATPGSYDGLSAAYSGDARILAERTAEELGRRHAPAHTAVSLDRAPGIFGDVLEQKLRADGFALGSSGLGVSYRLDVLDAEGSPTMGYVRVACTDGQMFSLTREIFRGTEAPSMPVREERPLESRPLPESVSPVNNPTAPVRKHTVKKTGTAAAVAKRCGIPVRDFCRWNQVGSNAVLEKGYEVYLAEPPAGLIPVAATVPVPAGASEEPSASQAAPMPEPVSLPSRAQTSPALRLGKPQVSEPVAYTPVAQVPKPAVTPLADAPAASSSPAPLPVVETDMEAVPVSQCWEIQKGSMLRGQLEGWAAVAGYSLIWNAQNDYEMRSSAMFSGEFIDAVKNFFAALQANGLALRVTIYQGNRVMEVAEH